MVPQVAVNSEYPTLPLPLLPLPGDINAPGQLREVSSARNCERPHRRLGAPDKTQTRRQATNKTAINPLNSHSNAFLTLPPFLSRSCFSFLLHPLLINGWYILVTPLSGNFISSGILEKPWMWPALVGGNFYLSYLVSVLMYVLVENPFNELGRFAIGVRRRGGTSWYFLLQELT